MRSLLIAALLLACDDGPSAGDSMPDTGAADAATPVDTSPSIEADMVTPDAAPVTISSQVKISIRADGVYLITAQDLVKLGFNLSQLNPRTMKMFNRGKEVPVHVSGGDDGTFDSGDYIEFFGAGISRSDLSFVYTETNVYWLLFNKGDGLRMVKKDGTPSGGASVPGSFSRTLHMEQDTNYWQSLPQGKGQDHWFWGSTIYKGKKDYTFSVQNLDQGAKTARVRVTVRGRSATSAKPDHHTKILLNGTQVSDKLWDGTISLLHDETISASLLKEGVNTLTFESVADTSSSLDMTLFNWFEIVYWSQFIALKDVSDFSYTDIGAREFAISGFSSSDLHAYDVTDPNKPRRILVKATKDAGGTYSARFE